MSVYEKVGSELVETETFRFPSGWNDQFKNIEGDIWVAGLQWDVSKADKPSSINKPFVFDKDLAFWKQFKSTSSWGMCFVVCFSEEDCEEAFKLLCHKLVKDRKATLEYKLKKFEEISKKFLDKHTK